MPQGKGQETKGQGQRLHPTPAFLTLPDRPRERLARGPADRTTVSQGASYTTRAWVPAPELLVFLSGGVFKSSLEILSTESLRTLKLVL